MTLPFGIDISKYQGVNDYAKIKANAAFVLIKATESWGYVDPKFVSNWQGLAGHRRAAYVYVWLSDDPLRQANHLIDTVTRAGVDWQHDRLVLDLEKSGHGLSKAEVARRVLIMMERIKEVTGRYPILYSRASWVNDNMLVTDPRIANADWWLAHYLARRLFPLYTPEKASPPALPIGVNSWLIHQTCERGNGSAVGVGSYYVDCDRWNGTREQMLAYFGLEGQSDPEPPADVLFDAKVTAMAGLRIRSGAGTNYPKTGLLAYKEVVSVYEVAPGWYRHSRGGWSSSEYLEPLGSEPPEMFTPYYGALYWQRDPRWKDKPLGTKGTIGGWGCAMVSETNVLNQLGIATNPVENNAWRTANGGYANGNLIVWEKVTQQHPTVIWEGKTWNPSDAKIKQKINEGCGLVMLVDQIESTPELNEHWVDSIPSDDGVIWIHDPWDNWTGRLRDRYKKPIQQFSSYRRVN